MIYLRQIIKQIVSDNILIIKCKYGPLVLNNDSDLVRLSAVIDWLEKSIETGNGGSSGEFNLISGSWSHPFPETTGYIIPTLIKYSKDYNKKKYSDLALKICDWLISVQMQNGACMGGYFNKSKNQKPIIFNTGQNILGFISAYYYSNDNRYLNAAINAGDFLINCVDDNFIWNSSLHNNLKHTYNSRSSWALLQLYKTTGIIKYKKVAEANLNWVINQQQKNGWFNNANFKKNEYPNTHGLAYTIRGLIESYDITKNDDYLKSCLLLSEKFKKMFEIKKLLFTFWDNKFKNHDKIFKFSKGEYVCITGIIQMSLVWMRIYQITGDKTYLSSAFKVIDFVKNTQDIKTNNKNIYGGIKGSLPVYGKYAFMKYPNWASKFFADSLMLSIELKNELETKI